MEEINILITSVSRKVWLIERFRESYKKLNINGKIIGIDVSVKNPGMILSDKNYEVPKIEEPNFLDEIISICKKEKIKIIIPTRDADLLFFSKNKKIFESMGILIPISNEEAINICNDKYIFFNFCNDNNILVPKTWLKESLDKESINFPLFIKPKDGAGSISTYIIESNEQLSLIMNYVKNPIIQEYIKGEEYTIDAFIDLDGEIIFVIPRKRVQIVGGESYKGVTIENEKIIENTIHLIKKIKLIGHVTIQCIENDNKYYFIDVNPRFGGGATLGIEAGGDSPSMILKISKGEKIKPIIGKYTRNLHFLRYTKDLFVGE